MYPANQTVTYYGRLKGKLYGEGLAHYMVNEVIGQMIEKHKDSMKMSITEFIKEFKENGLNEIKVIKNKLSKTQARITILEKTIKKLKGGE